MTTEEKIAAFERLIIAMQTMKTPYSGMCGTLTHVLGQGIIEVCECVYIDCLIKKELKELNLVYLFDKPKTTPRLVYLFDKYEVAPRIA